MKKKNKWHYRFLNIAKEVSSWSKDPSTKVGAVIVDKDQRFISLGYNGFPKGVKDTIEKLKDREQKYKHMVHAERNALLFANKSLKGCTIYTYPFMPCSECASMIIQSGIKKVFSFPSEETYGAERWNESFKISKNMFKEAGVKLKILNYPYEPVDPADVLIMSPSSEICSLVNVEFLPFLDDNGNPINRT